jgi:hypothetical protein
MKKFASIFLFSLSFTLLMGISKCDHPALERPGIPPIDSKLESARIESSKEFPTPKISRILRKGNVIWQEGDAAPKIIAGETLDLEGSGFGAGTNIDYSKILIGKARALELDLPMYTGNVDVKAAIFFEANEIFDTWKKDIQSWSDTHIQFKVPVTTDHGPIVVSVQKRIGANASLSADRKHSVWNPLTERVRGAFDHESDVVSVLSAPKLSNAVEVTVSNDKFKSRVEEGGKIFWSYDFNIGSVHNARNMDWPTVLAGKAIDPMTGKKVDPKEFGAIPITSSLSVPHYAREKVDFDPYPIPNPLSTVVGGRTDFSGTTSPTGYVGFIYASSLDPKTGIRGNWVGFSCASCHGQQISYPDKSGNTITKVFPGLPNHNWNMRWALLSKFDGVKDEEVGVSGKVDKTPLMYQIPNGAGEHTIVRSSNDTDAFLRNDFFFSPIAFPTVTSHTPLRRALSRTEFFSGFEGSYIHSEEPDGAIGAMLSDELKSLTAYMTTLDKDDGLLHQLGIYRWLKENKILSEVDNVSEKEFVYSDRSKYPILVSRLNRGQEIYQNKCMTCHATNFGSGSDENMMPISKVGTYFSPTVYQRETQSIKTALMSNLYWTEKRGLLHDTHVKSLEDLVNPQRCDSTSDLYKKYYTLNSSTFKVPIGNEDQAKFTEKHAYFTRVSWDKKNFYWDYQKMLKEFGIKEFGRKVAMVSTPHPWCAEKTSDIKDLVSYLLTL